MSKSSKIAIIVLGCISFLLAVIYFVLSAFNNSMPKELVYPVSGLSQSIFDSQNMKYTPVAELPVAYSFQRSPYTIDVPQVDAANVGEYAYVYKVSDSTYIYITEYKKDTSLDELIRLELSKAVMIDADTTMSLLDTYVSEEGYCNGFKAKYRISGLTVTNGTRTGCVYLTGYELTITEMDYDHGHNMFVSIVTSDKSSEGFASAKSILDLLMSTYQYSEKVENAIVSLERAEEEQAEREAEKGTQQTNEAAQGELNEQMKAEENKITTTKDANDLGSLAEENQYTASGEMPRGEGSEPVSQGGYTLGESSGIPQYKEMTVRIPQDAQGVQLYFYYTNVNEDVTVTLYTPDKALSYLPVSAENGTALFQLDTVSAGEWILAINGSYGTCSMKMYTE